ncbi:MAG: FkbM family methyltransferase [Acidobacteria bacterium]|nr:FkbM family methyltransferase [Acidobacteriota bacterium]
MQPRLTSGISIEGDALFDRVPNWEKRLLASPAGRTYQVIVRLCCLAFLGYFRHRVASLPNGLIWEKLGERFLFRRRYIEIAETSFGAKIICNTKDLIQRYIMAFGVWEPDLTAFIKRRLSKGDVFIDLGANIGYFSLLASQIVGKEGKVIAIEAAPQIFEALLQNLSLNQIGNVRPALTAVAAESGLVSLYSGGSDNLGASTIIAANARGPIVAKVSCDRFESIVKPEELARARMVKIDLEGAEVPPLRALIKFAPNLRRDLEIVVELCPARLRVAGSSINEILTGFNEQGFSAYQLRNTYTPGPYIDRYPVLPPKRIRSQITEQADLVFSRVDAEEL